MQVLFPEPTMRRLRERAKAEDRPMSDIVRRATEDWLAMKADRSAPLPDAILPTFRLGLKTSDPDRLRELIYAGGNGAA